MSDPQTTGVWIFNTEMDTSTAVCKSIERLSGRKIVLGPPLPEGRHTSSLTHVGVYYEQQGMQKVMTEIPTTIPDTVPALQSLVRLCEQRIHELEWERLNREECFCDRYTCQRCQALQAHQPFIRGATNVRPN